ncbi:major capsid protein [Acinetobacter towneri]|uniref:major capsid protein n=1 Tax=Acinetobacter towneri TaxID=202956 RepID=UPI003A83D243
MSNLKNVEVMENTQKRQSFKNRAYALVAASAVAAPAMAEDWSTEIVTTITGTVATVSAIGLAVLTLYVTAKVFKWVKTAM